MNICRWPDFPRVSPCEMQIVRYACMNVNLNNEHGSRESWFWMANLFREKLLGDA